MKGIFGPRWPSYSYSSNNYLAPSHVAPSFVPSSYVAPSYGNLTLNPYYRPSYAYPQYSQYSNVSRYPVYPQSPTTRPYQNPIQNHASYNWGTPEIILPSQGLESVLIAILILVVLDMIIVRPLKNSPS